MTRVAQKEDIKQFMQASLLADARQTAGSNFWISRAEQAKATNPLIAAGAEQVRVDGGAGTWVGADKAADAAMQRVLGVLRQVNQPSGPGHSLVSQAEIRAARQIDQHVGDALGQAYEVVRGLATAPTLPSGQDPVSVLKTMAIDALQSGQFSAVEGIPWQVRNQREVTSFYHAPLEANIRVFANSGAVFLAIGASANSPARPLVGFHYVGNDPTR